MQSDEVNDPLLSTVPCFSGAFVMTNMTHKREKKKAEVQTHLKHLFLEGLPVFKKPAYTHLFQC